jgi:hypothetical protein
MSPGLPSWPITHEGNVTGQSMWSSCIFSSLRVVLAVSAVGMVINTRHKYGNCLGIRSVDQLNLHR